ncbi:MAG: exodeoxyribonuclease VII large subunit, partial [Pseudomonadota bacterium]
LMPFNDERVVRAIAASDIPIICAVGHETDTSLADYAADLRAPTPTGAAEKAVPVRTDLITGLKQSDARLHSAIRRCLNEHRTQVQGLTRGLTHPRRMLENIAQKLDNLAGQLDQGLINGLHQRRQRLITATAKLSLSTQQQKLQHHSNMLTGHTERLNRAMRQRIETHKNHLQAQAALLETLSFKKTLERGFAVIRDDQNRPLTSAKTIKSGQKLKIEFTDGETKVTSQ